MLEKHVALALVGVRAGWLTCVLSAVTGAGRVIGIDCRSSVVAGEAVTSPASSKHPLHALCVVLAPQCTSSKISCYGTIVGAQTISSTAGSVTATKESEAVWPLCAVSDSCRQSKHSIKAAHQ